jgi:citrate lyase subunit beta / citryl-CoA lyase
MLDLPRTYLFVPGDRPERFAKALASGADAVVLDLEDAVATPAKAAARAAVAAALAGDAAHLVVRINDLSTAWFADDLAMLAARHAPVLMLPKAERADDIAHLRAACPDIAVLALVESARGVLAAEALAGAPGVQRLVFGTRPRAVGRAGHQHRPGSRREPPGAGLARRRHRFAGGRRDDGHRR